MRVRGGLVRTVSCKNDADIPPSLDLMLTIWIDATFALIMAASGVLAGWWLRDRSAGRSRQDDRQRQHAREALLRLQELAKHIAAHVGAHQQSGGKDQPGVELRRGW